MKAQIENVLLNLTRETTLLYAEIINTIFSSKDENELRLGMKILCKRYIYLEDYFEYGFGGNHMWVTQQTSTKNDRLIFVEF